MKVTKELLVGAADDLNSVLKLNPAIATAFESSLKGAALKAVEDKFLEQLKKDLVECSELIVSGDPVKASTVDVLEAIGVEGIRDKVNLTAPETALAMDEKQEAATGKGEEKTEEVEATPKKTEEKEVSKVGTKAQQKAPAAAKKAAPKTPAPKKTTEQAREVDQYGFGKGSHSSEAIKMIAAGKPLKDARKKFNMLSFSKLLKALEGHGFKVKEEKDGTATITGKLKS